MRQNDSDMPRKKRILLFDEQIKHLKSKGVTFELCDEATARECFSENDRCLPRPSCGPCHGSLRQRGMQCNRASFLLRLRSVRHPWTQLLWRRLSVRKRLDMHNAAEAFAFIGDLEFEQIRFKLRTRTEFFATIWMRRLPID